MKMITKKNVAALLGATLALSGDTGALFSYSTLDKDKGGISSHVSTVMEDIIGSARSNAGPTAEALVAAMFIAPSVLMVYGMHVAGSEGIEDPRAYRSLAGALGLTLLIAFYIPKIRLWYEKKAAAVHGAVMDPAGTLDVIKNIVKGNVESIVSIGASISANKTVETGAKHISGEMLNMLGENDKAAVTFEYESKWNQVFDIAKRALKDSSVRLSLLIYANLDGKSKKAVDALVRKGYILQDALRRVCVARESDGEATRRSNFVVFASRALEELGFASYEIKQKDGSTEKVEGIGLLGILSELKDTSELRSEILRNTLKGFEKRFVETVGSIGNLRGLNRGSRGGQY